MALSRLLCVVLLAAACGARAESPAAAAPAPRPAYDAALAQSFGAGENGMRGYVLVILKTGPKRMPDGPARDEMFRGHFANINRRADEGKLVMAGPLDGVDGWRGMFVFAVTSIDEARALVATDPVVINGEMVPEFHTLYSTAGLMGIPEVHKKLVKPR